MIGILREIFDKQIDELMRIYTDAKDTPFAIPSPVIVDIDNGQVMQIEKYSALIKMTQIFPGED